ncbi:MAG: AraC family transcriptional regulator [Spongiibacteraceae bacterium]|nr:AraC family transcriptional regulator [Spongiibacteraceae bacterium]
MLDYIHEHLTQALSVEAIAEKSCWSRWQLQRVFSKETGLSIAQYVRELRLSLAAEYLLSSNQRQLDIALACGFESEISFSRSFKQFFACSPGNYRRRGQRIGIRTPLCKIGLRELSEQQDRLLQIRIETRPAFELAGVRGAISGIFASEPNFAEEVPRLWRELGLVCAEFQRPVIPGIGVFSVLESVDGASDIPYWAGYSVSKTAPVLKSLTLLQVPAQLYAVIPFVGPIAKLPETLEWFVCCWLPESDYCGVDGYDLEIYGADFDIHSERTRMEYWVPVTLR